jgi:hypothetical protein
MAHVVAHELDALLADDDADDGLMSPPRSAPHGGGGGARGAAAAAAAREASSPSASPSPPSSCDRFPGPAAAYARSPALLALRDGAGGGSEPPWSPEDDAAAAAARALARAHGGAFASRAWREGLAAVGLRAFDASPASPLAPGAGRLARGGGGGGGGEAEPARVRNECVAPCVLAVVAALSATPFGDARATLCDPSGCVEALLSADVAEGGGEGEEGHGHAPVTEGALLLLRDVPLLAPSLEPRRRALVVSAACVARVWAPPLRSALALADGRAEGGGGGGGGALVPRPRQQQATAPSVPPPPPEPTRVPPPPPLAAAPIATAPAAAAPLLSAIVPLPAADDWSMLDAAQDDDDDDLL